VLGAVIDRSWSSLSYSNANFLRLEMVSAITSGHPVAKEDGDAQDKPGPRGFFHCGAFGAPCCVAENYGRNASRLLTCAWLICDLSHGLAVANTYLCNAQD
jgi:hypothetical protein